MTTDLGLVSSPSPGSSSTSTSNSTHSTSLRKVLLLIECQVCRLAPPPEGVPNSALVGRNIERALRFARASPCPPLVVHVRNSGDVGDADQPGAPGWQLALAPAPGEPVIDKTKNNAFAGTRLGELVDTIIFCTIAAAAIGITTPRQWLEYTLLGFFYKVVVQYLAIPVTAAVIRWLKRTDPTYQARLRESGAPAA